LVLQLLELLLLVLLQEQPALVHVPEVPCLLAPAL